MVPMGYECAGSANRFTVMNCSRFLAVTTAFIAAACAPLAKPAAFEANSSVPDAMPTVVPATVRVIASEIAQTQVVDAITLTQTKPLPASQTPAPITKSAGGSSARTVTNASYPIFASKNVLY